MNLYLDTEFNGHGGELMSLALAGDDGHHFYMELPLPTVIHPWVAENVATKLHGTPVSKDTFRNQLKLFLTPRSGCTIWADWPDDFAHLMTAMSGPSYDKSFMVTCEMRLIETPEGWPKPATPHNALSDAIALMDWHRESGSKHEAR